VNSTEGLGKHHTGRLTSPPKEADPFLTPASGPPVHLCQQQHLWDGVTNFSSGKTNPVKKNSQL